MKKLMTRWYELVRRMRQKYGDEKYEWLVACHMWHVIARRLAEGKASRNIPKWKSEIAYRYEVAWIANCWLCNRFQDCSYCPLKTCSIGSVYTKATLFGNTIKEKVAAARYIEEAIYAVRDKV